MVPHGRWGEVVNVSNFDSFAEYLSGEALMISMLSSECVNFDACIKFDRYRSS